MNTFLNKYRVDRSEEGFTLIELMIVVVIIGILAAIAIPIFANQQKAAHDATLKSDMKSSLLTVQTWISKNPTASAFNPVELRGMVSVSPQTRIAIHGTPADFCVQGSNLNAELRGVPADTPTKPTYMTYSSLVGGSIDSSKWISDQSCTSGGSFMLNTAVAG